VRAFNIGFHLVIAALALAGCGRMDLKVTSKMKSPADPGRAGGSKVEAPAPLPLSNFGPGATSENSGTNSSNPFSPTLPNTNTSPIVLPQMPRGEDPDDNADEPISTTEPHTAAGPSVESRPGPSTTPSPSAVEMAAGIRAFWDVKGKAGKEWTAITLEALEEYRSEILDHVPSDIDNYCPNYHDLGTKERMAFWVNFVAQMVDHESSFNTMSSHTEKFNDSSGTNVVSRGLLQLSGESVRALGCKISSARDLYEPRTNLNCGVRILAHYLSKDGRIFGYDSRRWYGAPRYWGIFRLSRMHTEIRTNLRKLPYCRG
jgi:hypothetical protein